MKEDENLYREKFYDIPQNERFRMCYNLLFNSRTVGMAITSMLITTDVMWEKYIDSIQPKISGYDGDSVFSDLYGRTLQAEIGFEKFTKYDAVNEPYNSFVCQFTYIKEVVEKAVWECPCVNMYDKILVINYIDGINSIRLNATQHAYLGSSLRKVAKNILIPRIKLSMLPDIDPLSDNLSIFLTERLSADYFSSNPLLYKGTRYQIT